MRPGALLPFAAALLCLGACRPQMVPPEIPGACWLMTYSGKDRRDFASIGANVSNLESCAARVEAVRMRWGGDTVGYYGGLFIFASETEISAAHRLDGRRWWVFEAGERRKLQQSIAALMARTGEAPAKAPQPGASG